MTDTKIRELNPNNQAFAMCVCGHARWSHMAKGFETEVPPCMACDCPQFRVAQGKVEVHTPVFGWADWKVGE